MIPANDDTRAMWRAALRSAAVGWEIVAELAIGYGMGWGLDRWLGTRPWLAIVGTLFGVAAAVRTLVRVVREYKAMVGPDDEADENAPPRPAWEQRRKRPRRKGERSPGPREE